MNIHRVPTMQLQAPDPSWLEEPEPDEALVQDPRFAWEAAPEQPWEEFSLEHVQPPPPSNRRVLVSPAPVDDTFEQAVLLSGVGAVIVAVMCSACAAAGFVVGLLVAS